MTGEPTPAPPRQTAVVSGAGSARGIGRRVALRLAEDGYAVAALDIDGAGARETADLVATTWGVPAIAQQVDVTDPGAVDRAVGAVEAGLPPIAVLANVAGVTRPTPFDRISLAEWNMLFAVNVTGTFLLTQRVLGGMRERGYGRIINMSSVSAQRGGGIFGSSHYSATKAAVLGLTKALAREVAGQGITVNAVAPSMVDTDIAGDLLTDGRKRELAAGTLVGRLASTDDVAAAVAFLAAPSSSYITGFTLDVNGGTHLH